MKGLKTNYDDLKKGDYVVVCSKLLAKPRLAYEITVKEKPKDEAVDSRRRGGAPRPRRIASRDGRAPPSASSRSSTSATGAT